LYQAWQNMVSRTTPGSAHQRAYPSYIGVQRDPRWESFTTFRDDMGTAHFPGACLARYGDSGDYTPDNCRWTTKTENARDRIKHFTSSGRPALDVARENGIAPGTFYKHLLYAGWSADEAAGVVARV
jgi:hypothetical protein